MKLHNSLFCARWSTYLQLQVILIFSINLAWLMHPVYTSIAPTNETDHLALLKFKESIHTDPHRILTSWNHSNHFCNWVGITCGVRHQRVISIHLQGYELGGSISPYIGNLSFLINFTLQNNSFYGQIPREVGRLFRLQKLVLANNTLRGEIPVNLTKCSKLKIVSVAGNKLTGEIPKEIGFLKNLEVIHFMINNLTGGIPHSLGNLSSLRVFAASDNNMVGSIPDAIGRLKRLSTLFIADNKFSGKLPSSLYNLSSLITLSLADNKFEGVLPYHIDNNFQNLQQFGIFANEFYGTIPASLSNLSKLLVFDIGGNKFRGQVSINLGNLQDLQWLGLGHNNFGNNLAHDLDFLTSLANCSKLERLNFASNNFGGVLPNSIANLSSQLIELNIGSNHISGSIPEGIGNLISLYLLGMEDNLLTGIIPTSLGRIPLQYLSLSQNGLSGHLPSFIGNLTRLNTLLLYQNKLEGSIPSSIGNCQNLQILDIAQNNLSGPIPKQIIGLSSILLLLNLSENSFTGSLPMEVGKLDNINFLDLSEDNLSGEIPATIGDCSKLEYLYLQGNFFQGNIPSSLAFLKGLQYLDLSRNNLSGEIPKDLAKSHSSVLYLNLSFNNLVGEVPVEGVFKNASAISVTGNSLLCGGLDELSLPACPVGHKKKENHHVFKLIITIVSVALFLLLLLYLLAMFWMRRSKRKSSSTQPTIEQVPKVSYRMLHQATDGFSPNNLVGSGSFGSVYKGFLAQEEREVAVKVLHLQKKGASKSFIAECNALRNIRHRNLVKILTCCSSADYNGNDFKALVFNFMGNGSLEQWLYPGIEGENESRRLHLLERLNIAIDVASALHYLHEQCEQPIVHCDLKPSNVLLDNDMIAQVTDFGLAKIIFVTSEISQNQSSTQGIKGSIGYAAPEYGMGGQVSTKGDVYSFGILLLEMFIGRRPTEDMFKDGLNLHKYAMLALPENLSQILDPTLLQPEAREIQSQINDVETEIETNLTQIQMNSEVQKCILSVFNIALSCSSESPSERMKIGDVTKELNLVKNSFLGTRNQGGRPRT
ncbi:putative Receptor-kinase [Quillaja saponaria]|uniref:non-specific serine/threonine protein kinase n=1 Tax=Quillaja saponaria TaxID=32244 RepID=A0AAD7VNT9_QUISA|nr:putative Receptor-kinase [Quillaja saponaria]